MYRFLSILAVAFVLTGCVGGVQELTRALRLEDGSTLQIIQAKTKGKSGPAITEHKTFRTHWIREDGKKPVAVSTEMISDRAASGPGAGDEALKALLSIPAAGVHGALGQYLRRPNRHSTNVTQTGGGAEADAESDSYSYQEQGQEQEQEQYQEQSQEGDD